MPTKYVARLNGEIVARRTTKDRTYSHCILITYPNGNTRSSWASRLDLAQKEARNWQTPYDAIILPAEVA